MKIDRRAPHWVAIAAAVGTTLSGCASTPTATRAAPQATAEFLDSPDPAMAALPFSEAVRAGDLLFLSGQIGNLPGTLEVVPGGMAAEARQTLENIRAILERHGATLDQVIKCTVFLADMRDWPAFNAVYRQFFPARFPARSALGANGLAIGARVEVECLAYSPAAPK